MLSDRKKTFVVPGTGMRGLFEEDKEERAKVALAEILPPRYIERKYFASYSECGEYAFATYFLEKCIGANGDFS